MTLPGAFGVPRVLPGFLGPRDRVVVATMAHAATKRDAWEEGRQGTGYQKLNVVDSPTAARLVKKCLKMLGDPMLYDAWVLRYPVGAEIPAHVDPNIEGMCHVRINAIALGSEGGVLYVDGAEVALDHGDAYVFRPDVMKHMVTKVERNERLVLSVGANVPAEQAAKAIAG